jgi:hypothetical protein
MFESTINKVISSIFVVNKDAHDSNFDPSMGDCRGFWQEVVSLEKLFYCEKCNKPISKKYYDNVRKKIRCNDGHLEYDWNN